MDVNWCVVCDRHFDDIESTLYCSEACRNADLPVELESTTANDSSIDKSDIVTLDDASFSPMTIATASTNPSTAVSSSVLPLKNTTGFITTPDFCAHRRARSLSNRLPLPNLHHFGVTPMAVPVRITRSSVELHSSGLHHTLTNHAVNVCDDVDTDADTDDHSSDLASTPVESTSAPIATAMASIAHAKRYGLGLIYRNNDSGFATKESSPFLSEDDNDNNNNSNDDDDSYNNNEGILQSGEIHGSNTNTQPKQQEKLPRNATCCSRNDSSTRHCHYVSRFHSNPRDDPMNKRTHSTTTDACWPTPHYSTNDTSMTGSNLMSFDSAGHANLPRKNSFDLSGLGVCVPQLEACNDYGDANATFRISDWQTTTRQSLATSPTSPRTATLINVQRWLKTSSWQMTRSIAA
ncbi:hypothetical protein BDF22DRAFT_745237 [Syncephalis plumigaleata]|nr:hypothetical protein BDF22DRAFT_745237 [Syncephalis plumigaleata]